MKIPKPISKQTMPPDAKLVFHGVIFDVYQWEQPGYDGTIKTFEKIKRLDTATVIAITEDGKILLSKQEQPGKQPFITTVGGRIDKGEDPLEAAKRELLEETGFVAKEWILFEALQPISKIEWSVYCFIAKGCQKVSEQNLDGGEKIDLLPVDFDTFIEMVIQENFSDPELKIKMLEAKLNPDKMAEYKKLFGLT